MPKQRFAPIVLKDLETYSLQDRPSKVGTADFAARWQAGGSFASFLGSLPKVLAADDLRAVVAAVVAACRDRRPVVAGMGAHVSARMREEPIQYRITDGCEALPGVPDGNERAHLPV